MKKVIVAIDNKKILNKIKKTNNLKINFKRVQYREAILEILKKEKNIDIILMDEKLSGEISIENLINKIKKINKRISIIFFLRKKDLEKENKLRKLKIEKIYFINQINLNKISNLLNKNKETNINFKNRKNIEINKNNKIITIYGEAKSGKSTIINLLIIYLIEKNKKILLINLNNKIENNYLILLEKNIKKNNKFGYSAKNSKIEINKNLTLIYDFQKILKDKKIDYFFKRYIENYDYILVDVGYIKNDILRKQIINQSNKKIIVWNNNFLCIKEIKELLKKNKENQAKFDKSLHIIQNKYYFYSISYLITKSIFRKLSNVHKILYDKKYINLNQKILKQEKVKIKNSIRNQIKKILN